VPKDALREADGGYVTVEGIVLRAMQEKGMDFADTDMRDDFTRRFTWTHAMLSRGVVRKAGSRADARWALAAPRGEVLDLRSQLG
jgi:hypothetical protein